MSELDDVIQEFVSESREALDALDRELVALEEDPDNRDLLARIFRRVHSIKGACGFLGFAKLEGISHVGEGLLALLRKGTRRMTPARATGLLRLVDAMREIVGRIEQTGAEGADDYADLIAQLGLLHREDGAPDLGELLIERGVVAPRDVALAAMQQARGDPRRIGEILVEQANVPPRAIVEALEAQGEVGTASGGRAGGPTVRVEARLLERLAALVADLETAGEDLASRAAISGDPALPALARRLGRVATSLRDGLLEIRRQPIGRLWDRFPRLARDLSLTCGKRIVVRLEGNEVQLDREVLDAIKDPITHLVRNAIDHGIEPPADRAERGKPLDGCLTLRAVSDPTEVRIEIADDGRGIDLERVRSRARESGVMSADRSAALSDGEAIALLFQAGFSTAERVTTVSGRGVGMDVVRTRIGRLGGSVEIDTAAGRGTTVRLRIPVGQRIAGGEPAAAGGQRRVDFSR